MRQTNKQTQSIMFYLTSFVLITQYIFHYVCQIAKYFVCIVTIRTRMTANIRVTSYKECCK